MVEPPHRRLGHGSAVIQKLLWRAQLQLPAAMPGLEAPLVRRLRRLIFCTLGIAALGLTLQIMSALMGWRAYACSPRGTVVAGLRHWLARYVAMDTLLPVCALLAEPLDPAQPLMCAFVATGAISLRFHDIDLAWKELAPETWDYAALALTLSCCGACCAVAVAIGACAVGRHVWRLQVAYGPNGPTMAQAIAKIVTLQPAQVRSCQECSICLEAAGDSSSSERWCELECRHRFHRKCLLKWLQQQHQCPLCRWNLHAAFVASSV